MALTKQQKEEFVRCKKDPIYFIENYVYIETEEYGIILFKLFEYQKELIKELLDGTFQLHHWRKSRQIGCSTVLSAFAVWLCNFHMSKSVAIVATDLRTAKKLHAKAMFAWTQLPDWMRMKHENKNLTQLFLKNRSKIEAFPYSKDKGTRSISASLVVMDECAFMPNADDVWGAIEPSLSNSGNVVALSSPDAPQGWFYDTYFEQKMLEDVEREWNLVKLSWEVHPERDQEWRDLKTKRLGKRKASREYDAEFGISDRAYFDADFLDFIKENHVKEPIKKLGALWIWEYPQEGEQYIISVDPAEGSNDRSVIQVIKLSTLEQVAEYVKKIHYDKFNPIPTKISRMYNNGLLVIEDNSIGKTTISRTKDLNYFNLYKRGQTKKERQILGITTKKDGWNTNTKSRPIVINTLESFIETEEGFCIIQSERLMEELMSFEEKNGKAQASSNAHDDAIMAWGIGLTVYTMRGISLETPDETYDVLEMYSAINKSAQEKYKELKDYNELIENSDDEEREKERLKKKNKDILNERGNEMNMTNPFVEMYAQTYREEFGF